ncbi:MAG: hypothetical protein M3247_07925 [Thermoproteota archaeon]|nr:hypothetical protein [Acidobacteriota bacterium]MDQ3903551.1 hypothetical protein [Thermoproteota archaeon]
MKEVYFDTNIYTHIYNRKNRDSEITEEDINKLLALKRADKIRILSSVTVLEETIGATLSAPKEAVGRLKLIRKLAKRKRIIQENTGFKEDIFCYARGEKPHRPFISPPPEMKEVLTNPNHFDLNKIAQDTKAKIEKFHKQMSDAYKTHIEPLAAPIRKQKLQPSFQEYWGTMRIAYAEELAKQAGVLEQCRERGLEGLLAIRSIHIAAFANTSLVYANTYEGRTQKKSDSRDMHHAVLSSATDAFITDDKNLRRILTRLPIQGYEVMSFKELLSRFH